MAQPIVFRPARPDDIDAAVPLIHQSGPAAFDYVFSVPGIGDAQAFLRHAFAEGGGEFGWRNHHVGELDGRVVVVGAAYGGDTHWPFTVAAARQILGHFGWGRGAGVIVRGLRVEGVIPPPSGAMLYLAHLAVHPELQGRGVGGALIDYLAALRRDPSLPLTLDVSAANPRAQALYERLGFVVTRERPSALSNAQGAVAAHRRMERRQG